MGKVRQSLLGMLPPLVRRRLRLARILHRLREQRRPVEARPHGLPGELIISLTSHTPRFDQLHLTLKSLLNQTVSCDRLILWIGRGDMGNLPRSILNLGDPRFEVRAVDDLRSYNKLVHALEAFPEAYIVTADDDLFYPPEWLAPLVDDWEPGLITCRRAHRILGFDEGEVTSYRIWPKEVEDAQARIPSKDILPTGVGGVLYPPHSLHMEVTDSATFMALAPRADDLWFYMMARKAGTLHKKVGGHFEQMPWPGSQEIALINHNMEGNDGQWRKLLAHLGHPAFLGKADNPA